MHRITVPFSEIKNNFTAHMFLDYVNNPETVEANGGPIFLLIPKIDYFPSSYFVKYEYPTDDTRKAIVSSNPEKKEIQKQNMIDNISFKDDRYAIFDFPDEETAMYCSLKYFS